jgi:hypothetical protein
MPFCPKCGEEVSEDESYCTNCGENLRKTDIDSRPSGAQAGAMDHLSLGIRIATAKPMIFAPALIGGIVSILISAISSGLFEYTAWQSWASVPLTFSSLFLLSALLSVIGAVISYILNFASIDMSRDAYMGEALSLGNSINYVLRRILTFIVASVIGAIMSITIILIPVALLMFVIMVMDETGIGDAISKAFGVLTRDLVDIILVLLVAVFGSLILGFIPLVGGLLTACLNVVIGLALIDIYFKYKTQS